MKYEIEEPKKYINSFLLEKESDCFVYRDGDKFFVATEKTLEEALAALEAHNPPAPSEPTVSEKLASVGLSVDDLKAALGLA